MTKNITLKLLIFVAALMLQTNGAMALNCDQPNNLSTSPFSTLGTYSVLPNWSGSTNLTTSDFAYEYLVTPHIPYNEFTGYSISKKRISDGVILWTKILNARTGDNDDSDTVHGAAVVSPNGDLWVIFGDYQDRSITSFESLAKLSASDGAITSYFLQLTPAAVGNRVDHIGADDLGNVWAFWTRNISGVASYFMWNSFNQSITSLSPISMGRMVVAKTGNVAYLINGANVTKYNSSGSVLWTKTFASNIQSIYAPDGQTIYMVFDDNFVRKVDSNGNFIMEKALPFVPKIDAWDWRTVKEISPSLNNTIFLTLAEGYPYNNMSVRSNYVMEFTTDLTFLYRTNESYVASANYFHIHKNKYLIHPITKKLVLTPPLFSPDTFSFGLPQNLGSLELFWDTPGTCRSFSGYKIFGGSGELITTIAGQNIGSYTQNGLSNNISQTRSLKVFNAGLNGEDAYAPDSVTITSATLAAVPTNVGHTFVLPSNLRISWSDSTNPANTRYHAQISLSQTFSAVYASSITSSLSAVFSGIIGNTTYYYRVAGRNVNHLDTFSPINSAVKIADNPPGTILNLAIQSFSSTAVQLTWIAPSKDGVSSPVNGYDIRYSTRDIRESGCPDPAQCVDFYEASQFITGLPKAPGTQEIITIPNLFPGIRYFFAIKSLSDFGNVSLISNLVSTRTLFSDDLPPIGNVQINYGADSTSNSNVVLKLSVKDLDSLNGASSAPFRISLSADGLNFMPSEPFQDLKPFQFSSGSGLKRVFVKFADLLGNESIASDSILLSSFKDPAAQIKISPITGVMASSNPVVIAPGSSINFELATSKEVSGSPSLNIYMPDGSTVPVSLARHITAPLTWTGNVSISSSIESGIAQLSYFATDISGSTSSDILSNKSFMIGKFPQFVAPGAHDVYLALSKELMHAPSVYIALPGSTTSQIVVSSLTSNVFAWKSNNAVSIGAVSGAGSASFTGQDLSNNPANQLVLGGNFTVDATSPTVSFIGALSGKQFITQAGSTETIPIQFSVTDNYDPTPSSSALLISASSSVPVSNNQQVPVTSLATGTWRLAINATDFVNNSTSVLSGTFDVVTDSMPPSVPTGLVTVALSSTQISLSWIASSDNVGVVGYIVYRSTTQLSSSAVTSYSDNDLSPSTTYSYAVSAYDAAGNESELSLAVSTKTLGGAGGSATNVILIAPGETWKYFKGTVAPAAGWNAVSFDDVSWLSGPSGIGYGDGDDATIITDMQNNYITIYSRKTFTIADPLQVSSMTFIVDYDDGFVAYINGQEVSRRSMLAGTPAFNTLASPFHEAGVPEAINITGFINALVSGTNVLAIETHNEALNSSDLSMIPRLTATQTGEEGGPVPDTTSPTPPAGFNSIAISSRQINLSWLASSDNVAVTGYNLYRNGIFLSSPVLTSYADTGLTASTTYTYTIEAFDAASNESVRSTTTAATLGSQGVPVSSGSFIFTAAGDYHSDPNTSATLDGIAASGAVFNLAIGDLSYNTITPESAWADYVKSHVGPTFPFQLVSGNHEEDSGPDGFIGNFAAALPDRMNSTGAYGAQYYFDYQNTARFIIIAPNLAINGHFYNFATNSADYNWLANTIDAARAASLPWVVVGMHKVCMSMGEKSCEIGPDIMNLLLQKKVDLVLQAHDHTYQRSKQLALNPAAGCSAVASNVFNSNCVADASTSTYQKGNGPIIVVSAVPAGAPRANIINVNDAEAGYFASWMGNNIAGAGYAKFTVSPSSITGQFVQSAGTTTFTDRFTISSAPASDTISPSVPTGLVAVAFSSAQINLSWTGSSDNVDVAGYKVFRSTVQIGTATVPNYADFNLSPSTTYSYTVSAFDAVLNVSSPSIAVSTRTLNAPDTIAPSTPTGLVATDISTTQINLIWNPSSDNIAIAGYRVFRSTVQIASTTIPSYSDINLTPATTYTYTISAYDAAINISGMSNPVSTRTLSLPSIDTTSPTVPSVLTAVAVSSTQINLSWNASFDAIGVAGYQVIRNSVFLASSTVLNYSNIGLAPSTTYSYQISAYDTAGNISSMSATSAIVTLPASVPPVTNEVVGLVRQNCSGYSNCYTSLAAWESAFGGVSSSGCAAGNLVCAQKIAVAQIDGSWVSPDTTPVIIEGWTTSSTYYIKIYTTPAARHSGTWTSAAYRLENSGTPLEINEEFVTVDGLQIYMTDTSQSQWRRGIYVDLANAAANFTISNSIVRANGNVGDNGGGIWFNTTGAGSKFYILNTIIYGFKTSGGYTAGVRTTDSNWTGYLYSDIFNYNDYGVRNNGGTFYAKNCYAGGNSYYSYADEGGPINLTKCASSDDLGSSGLINIAYSTSTGARFNNVTSGSQDFHIKDTSSLKDAGVNTSTESAPLNFTTDIDGQTRSNPWDIGSDESITTQPDTSSPTVPSGLIAVAISSSQINLSWSASTDNINVTGYAVYRSSVQIASSAVTNYSDVQLAALTTYSYQVAAYDAAGNISNRTASVSTRTLAPVDSSSPSSPTGFSLVSVASTQVSFSWSASTDNVGVAGYYFYRNGSQVGTSNTTSYTDTNLTPNTTYGFSVAAYDAANNKSTQTVVITTRTIPIVDISSPSSPIGFTLVSVASTQVTFSWFASTDNVGVVGYYFYRNGSQVGMPSTTSYTDTNLTPNTTYGFSVAAYDVASNVSSQSVVITTRTLQNIDVSSPTVPAGLVAVAVSSSQINLSWSASTDNINVTGYVVYRSSVQIASSAVTNYSDIQLAAFTTYSYQVAAYDAAGNISTRSASVSTRTFALVDIASPSIPTGFSLISVASTQVSFIWSASTDNVGVAGYYFYRNGSQVGTSTTTSYTDTNLTPNTTYGFSVAAFDAANNVSSQSVAITTRTLPIVDTSSPSVPGGFSLVFVASTQVSFSWSASTDNVGVTGYNFYRNGSQVGTSTTTSYTDINLTPNTTYGFSVAAYDAANNTSTRSVVITTRTLQIIDTSSPTVPSGLVVVAVSSSQINLTWSASTDNVNVTGYAVYRSSVQIASSAVTNYSDIQLAAFTTYSYQVAAYDAAGNISNRTASVSTRTFAAVDLSSPSIPTGFTLVSIASTQASFTWSASTDNVGVTGYKFYRNGSQVGTSITTSYIDTNLTPNTTYGLSVAAYDAANNTSSQSVVITTRTLQNVDTSSPSVPAGLVAVAISSSQINLSWSASTDNVNVTRYAVYRSSVQIASSAVTNYSDVQLAAFTTYSYQVAAYDAAGNISTRSATVSTRTFASVDTSSPSIPTGFSLVSVASTQVSFSWSASTDNVAVTGYNFYRNGSQVGTSTTTSYTDTNLTSNTTYGFSVAAFDAANNVSSQSVVITTRTLTTTDTTAPSSPTGLVAVALSSTQISLSWSAASDNMAVTGYNIFKSTTQIATSTNTNFIDSNLLPATTYNYQVSAYDAAGNSSSLSSTATAVTQPSTAPVSNEVVRLIRQDCSGYSNCYTSLAAWESAFGGVSYGTSCASGNLTCAKKIAVAQIDGSWVSADTTPVIIDGWTTSSTYYIKIYTTPAARHSGKWSTSTYRLENSGTPLEINEEFVTVDGLQIYMANTSQSQWRRGIYVDLANAAANFTISNSIVRANGNVGDNGGGIWFNTTGAGSKFYILNTMIYGFKTSGGYTAGVRSTDSNWTGYMYSDIFNYNDYGIRNNGGTFYAKNCYAGGNSYYSYADENGPINLTKCASSDDLGSSGLINVAYSASAGAYFNNVTAGSEDYHLKSTSVLKDAGVNTSTEAAPLNFTNDIDGGTRSGTWDIGADEYGAGFGASAFTAFNNPMENTTLNAQPVPLDTTFQFGEVYAYPNPATGGRNPTIHVECGIADFVEIRFYDIAGELLHDTRVDQVQVVNNKYAYEYTWNNGSIASGVYVYIVAAKKSGERDLKIMKKLAIIR